MRGDLFHNDYLVEKSANCFEEQGFSVFLEYAIRLNDGRIDFITDTANQDATVSIGYYFVKGEGVLSFSDWDALRG